MRCAGMITICVVVAATLALAAGPAETTTRVVVDGARVSPGQPPVVRAATTAAPTGTVRLTPRAPSVAVGQPVSVIISNGTGKTIYVDDMKTDCSIVTLQRRTGTRWDTVGGCLMERSPITVAIEPGAQRTVTVTPASMHVGGAPGRPGFGAGRYRFTCTYRFTRVVDWLEGTMIVSDEFAIH